MVAQERSFRVEAVVLRHSDWGEADRMLVLFTLELGKVRTIAKGVRKARSRKAGHLEPFTRSSLLLARGREMLLVTQAETLEPFTLLRDDLLLTTYASYVVELLDRFTYEEGENRAIYALLSETLARLANGIDPDLAVRFYEIRLLDLLGFRPQLFHCMNCRETIRPEDQYSRPRWGESCARIAGMGSPGRGRFRCLLSSTCAISSAAALPKLPGRRSARGSCKRWKT
jgi:DNA repair protein RecO (recombination protein O)